MLRYVLGNVLLVSAILAIVWGGWLIWAVAAAIFVVGAPADEAIGDGDAQFNGASRTFFDIIMLLQLPLLVLLTLAMLYRVGPACSTAALYRASAQMKFMRGSRSLPLSFFWSDIALLCSARPLDTNWCTALA